MHPSACAGRLQRGWVFRPRQAQLHRLRVEPWPRRACEPAAAAASPPPRPSSRHQLMLARKKAPAGIRPEPGPSGLLQRPVALGCLAHGSAVSLGRTASCRLRRMQQGPRLPTRSNAPSEQSSHRRRESHADSWAQQLALQVPDGRPGSGRDRAKVAGCWLSWPQRCCCRCCSSRGGRPGSGRPCCWPPTAGCSGCAQTLRPRLACPVACPPQCCSCPAACRLCAAVGAQPT